MKDKKDKHIPIMITGINNLLYDIPEAWSARISLSEDILPIDINPPTNDENGKAKATIDGREYNIIRATFLKETFFESISSAISKSWLTKKMKKKKRKATTNENINSDKIYLYMVKKEDL